MPVPAGRTRSALRPAEEAGGEPLLELVRRQVDLGPRYPGSEAHRRLAGELGETPGRAARTEVHRAALSRCDLPGGTVECANLTGVFRPGPRRPGSARPARRPLLLGTHFDTRLTPTGKPTRRCARLPIPGANDGGSGTAILLSLLPELARLAGSRGPGPGGAGGLLRRRGRGRHRRPALLAGRLAATPGSRPCRRPARCSSWTWWAARDWSWTWTGTPWSTRPAWG